MQKGARESVKHFIDTFFMARQVLQKILYKKKKKKKKKKFFGIITHFKAVFYKKM